MPTAHYQNGGIPTNYHTKVIKGNMDGEEFVPGFFAAGECASASVHGANRLGTNSLLDLVVFGRTAGEQAAKYAAENTLVPLSEDAGNEGLAALQKYSNANGKHTFGELWGELTDVMQKKMSVFRTEQLMTECYAELLEIEAKMDDYKINDKSSVYNLDLIEALELNNMILVAKLVLRLHSSGKSLVVDTSVMIVQIETMRTSSNTQKCTLKKTLRHQEWITEKYVSSLLLLMLSHQT